MPISETYLDLAVGPYALAVAARSVALVRQDVRITPLIEVRGCPTPLCDLAALFGLGQRLEAPFVIAIEGDGRLASVGVDRVGHLRRRDAPTLRHLPAIGLNAPFLFAGALLYDDRLLLVVDPAALVALMHERLQTKFDPNQTPAV